MKLAPPKNERELRRIKNNSRPPSPSRWAPTLVCLFILLAMAGLLALSSALGATPEATPHEPMLYRVGSNAVQVLAPVAPFLPPPFNALVEGVLALGGALLAFWASHIHRTVAEIKNGAPTPRSAAFRLQYPGTGLQHQQIPTPAASSALLPPARSAPMPWRHPEPPQPSAIGYRLSAIS